jgi:Zn-finger nucleic acid-binding protein
MSVLRKYLADDVVREFWLKTMNESTESDRGCPSCKQPLNEFIASKDEQRIRLDLCKKCQLIWFDKDELEAFPKTTAEVPSDIEQQLAAAKVDFDAELERHQGLAENICYAGIIILRLLLRSWLHI